TANGTDPRLSFWLRVREFAVPPTMIEAATDRRRAGDWRGSCAAAGFDVDLDLRVLRNRHGVDVGSQVLDDLRHLAPDLLRWHLPRVAPDGLLRPGLTISLARYGPHEHRKRCGANSSMHLIVRTAPAWADAGQRIALTLWDGSDLTNHPHPRPNRRFRLDLHRHLWDVRRAGELRERAGVNAPAPTAALDASGLVPHDLGCAVSRWASEAAILLRSQGLRGGTVAVRLAARRRLALRVDQQVDPPRTLTMRITAMPTKR